MQKLQTKNLGICNSELMRRLSLSRNVSRTRAQALSFAEHRLDEIRFYFCEFLVSEFATLQTVREKIGDRLSVSAS